MMELTARLKDLAEKSRAIGSTLKTEEATKMALVMPLLSHLGYDVHDPREICPEFICDVGEKKAG